MLWIDLWWFFFKFRQVLKKIGIPLNKGRVASLECMYTYTVRYFHAKSIDYIGKKKKKILV